MTLTTDNPRLLWSDHPEAFDRFADLERARIAAGVIPRPAGLRLSTSCPIRRVREVFDSHERAPIDRGHGERGHEVESRFHAIIEQHLNVTAQVAFKWGLGESAFDFQTGTAKQGAPVWAERLAGRTLEVKSSISTRTPAGYVGQVRRMMFEAGCGVDAEADIVIIDPSDWQMRGPFTVTLDQESHDACAAESAGVRSAFNYLARLDPDTVTKSDEWASVAWWRDEHGLEDSCGCCTRHGDNALDANSGIEDLAFRLDLAQRSAERAKQLLGGAKGSLSGGQLRKDIEAACIAQLAMRGQYDENGLPAGTVETWGTRYRFTVKPGARSPFTAKRIDDGTGAGAVVGQVAA